MSDVLPSSPTKKVSACLEFVVQGLGKDIGAQGSPERVPSKNSAAPFERPLMVFWQAGLPAVEPAKEPRLCVSTLYDSRGNFQSRKSKALEYKLRARACG
jgi:hypothetical protein